MDNNNTNTTTPEFARILAAAGALFMRYGFRSVSMSDIARELGMSKKTLYLHITNKDELILIFTRQFLALEREQARSITASAANALDAIIKITLSAQRKIVDISPQVVRELSRYQPKAWQLVDEFRREFILTEVRQNLEQGKAEGIYRADLNAEIICQIYIHSLPIFSDPADYGLHQYSPLELHVEYIKYHIHGILSEQGRALLQNYEF